jgi:hypothetical protein
MNDAPRRTLRELIARHGPGLCSDARRCEGLLRDLCGEHRREINILVGALRERAPLDLLAGRNSVPTGLLLTRLAKRLEDHLALTEGAARWAVDTWALALGVISDAELAETERRRDEAVAPRAESGQAATRPAAGDETPTHRDTTRVNTRPPAAPPRAQRSPSPPASQKPSATSQAGSRPAAPKATPPAAQGGSSAAARHYPSPPAARPPLSPQAANTGPLQTPSADAAPRGGRRRWRGCLVGCFLILLLAALLMAGAPFVLNVLREEEQQRNLEPPPGQTR